MASLFGQLEGDVVANKTAPSMTGQRIFYDWCYY